MTVNFHYKNVGYFQTSAGSKRDKSNRWVINEPMVGFLTQIPGLFQAIDGSDINHLSFNPTVGFVPV